MQPAAKPVLPAEPSRRAFRTRSQKGGALGTILAIIGGLVLACVVVALIVLWFVSRYVRVDVRDTAGATRVEIETPFGGLKVRAAEDIAAELNLPVYPGAWAADKSASINLWGGKGDREEGVDIAVAQFRTDEPLDKVDAWYRKQLGPEFKREHGREIDVKLGARRRRIHARGEGVAYVLERDGRTRGVALEPTSGGRVKITLFDVWEARGQ